jgi:predicted amidohydrolase
MCYSTSGSYPTSPANSYAYRRSVEQDHSDMLHAGTALKNKALLIACNKTISYTILW